MLKSDPILSRAVLIPLTIDEATLRPKVTNPFNNQFNGLIAFKILAIERIAKVFKISDKRFPIPNKLPSAPRITDGINDPNTERKRSPIPQITESATLIPEAN